MVSVNDALTAALADAPPHERDVAAVELARRYATLLDAATGSNGITAPDVLADIGPKLLATLTALGLTPAGRGLKGGATGGASGTRKLDELRERRAQRANRTG